MAQQFNTIGEKVRLEVITSDNVRKEALRSVVSEHKAGFAELSGKQNEAIDIVNDKKTQTIAAITEAKENFTTAADAAIANLTDNADAGAFDSLGEAVRELQRADASAELSVLTFHTSELEELNLFQAEMGEAGDVVDGLGTSLLGQEQE